MNVSKTACVGLLCVALTLVVLGSSAPVEAQQAEKYYRIGYLTPFPLPPTEGNRFRPFYRILEETLAQLPQLALF
jgi:hypothetical protein